MNQPVIPPNVVLPATWTAQAATTLNAWIVKVTRLLTGGLRLDTHSYAAIVDVKFTVLTSQPPVYFPPSRVTTPPVGIIPIRFVDTTDASLLFVVPTIMWAPARDGRVQLLGFDAVTSAALLAGHVYVLTAYIVGG